MKQKGNTSELTDGVALVKACKQAVSRDQEFN